MGLFVPFLRGNETSLGLFTSSAGSSGFGVNSVGCANIGSVAACGLEVEGNAVISGISVVDIGTRSERNAGLGVGNAIADSVVSGPGSSIE